MRRALTGVCAGALLVLLAGHLGADETKTDKTEPKQSDWPQWRGPNRSGVTPERSGWPESWPPKRLWKKSVGRGGSSPIIVDGRLYVMGWKSNGKQRGKNPVGTDTVYCLDALSGKEFWKQTYACRYQGRVRIGDVGSYGGPLSTPAFDPQTEYLYTLSVDGDFRCWNTGQGGKLVWRKNFYDEYGIVRRPNAGGGIRDFGCTSSPLVQDGLVLVEVGDDEGTVMAFDKRSGKRQWASACTGPAGHSSGPVSLVVQGKPCIATLTLQALVIMRADGEHQGKTIARYPWQTHFACNIPTPAVLGRRMVLTSGYNQRRTECLEISLTKVRPLWRSKQHATVSSPVIHGDSVYIVAGTLKCMDLATGNLKWKGGNFSHGTCLVAADDNKLLVFGRGTLALLEATPRDGRYRELSRVDGVVGGTCYPHVVLSRGIICCKSRHGAVTCFSIRRKAGTEN